MRTWSPETARDLRKASFQRRNRQGRGMRIAGLVLVVIAAVLGAYVWYLLYGTGLTTKRWQGELRPAFEKTIATKAPEQAPPPLETVKVPGGAVAIIDIPRIDLDMVVVEGTDTESLKKGPGHYADTAYPWQKHGRVAIAGHRTTYQHPFFNLDELELGDPIILETEYGIFRYEVTRVFITTPYDLSVLDQTRQPTLVLTTCNPKFSASQRLVVFAARVG